MSTMEVPSARVIQVIETRGKRGRGTDENPVRIVRQYWDFDGKLLAEYDSEVMEYLRSAYPERFR